MDQSSALAPVEPPTAVKPPVTYRTFTLNLVAPDEVELATIEQIKSTPSSVAAVTRVLNRCGHPEPDVARALDMTIAAFLTYKNTREQFAAWAVGGESPVEFRAFGAEMLGECFSVAERIHQPPVVGFSFNMKVEATPTAETLDIVRAALKHFGHQDELMARAVDAKIARSVSEGLATRAFCKWAATNEATAGALSMDETRWEIIFNTTVSKLSSLRREQQMDDPAVVCAMPYRQLMSYACEVSGHLEVDLFTAKSTDPIWKKLRIPLEWSCRCTVISMLDDEVERKDIADIQGSARFPKDLLRSIQNWQTRPPGLKSRPDAAPVCGHAGNPHQVPPNAA